MNITRAAIEKKRITSMALLLIIVWGMMTFQTMPRAEDPGFTIRSARVTTQLPGASPQRVEMLITDKLEKVIMEMPELDSVNSESSTGVSIITVNIKESYSNMRPIWDKLRRKMEDTASSLPSGVIGPNINDEFGDVFGVLIALTAEGYSNAEISDVADNVRNELLLAPDVAKVEIHGAQDERIFVEFNNARLSELGISPSQLQQMLQARNIIFPGGEVYTADEQLVLEPSGNFESLEALKQTMIPLAGGEIMALEDLARVSRDYVDPPRSVCRYEGERALIFGVSLREGGNIITLGEGIRQKLTELRAIYPIGVDFDEVYFQPDFVETKVDDFVGNLLQSIVTVIVVMLIFLGLRTGLVVASLIPMAMVMAIAIMGQFEIGLDQISLAALIIALGMLVDNAIVMSESVMVSMSEGKSAIKAAIDSASELRISLLTSSLTTSAAFLPIYIAEAAMAEFTASLFEVVTITLLCSWILAITMTPLLCVLFIKVKQTDGGNQFNGRFYRMYRGFLTGILRRPLLSLLGTIAIFIGVMMLFRFVDTMFFPPNDKPVMEARFQLPPGTPLAKTRAMMTEVDAFIAEELTAQRDGDGLVTRHGLENWALFIGASAPRYQLSFSPPPPSGGYAYLVANISDRWVIETDLAPRLEAFCRERFPDAVVKAGPLAQGAASTNPVEISITGRDESVIFDLVDKTKARLSELPGSMNIGDNWGERTKKLQVVINQARLQRAQLTNQDVALSLQTIFSGLTATDYREGEDTIPVVLRSAGADRLDFGKLESHNIFSQSTGRSVPLKQVGDVEVAFQPSKILRENRLKTVTVYADVALGANSMEISKQLQAWARDESKSWLPGYKFSMGGDLDGSASSSAAIMDKLPIGGLIILLLLVMQFDSFRRPAIILLTIPLGLIGVVLGLLITGQAFGFMPMLGVISLAGIVINNAIVLIDRIKIEIEVNGLEPARAVVEAAQRRMRPILLTTLTTVGGLVPLWLGGGSLFESMAVAILFGLIFATMLTLGFVPVLYALFFRVSFRDFKYDE